MPKCPECHKEIDYLEIDYVMYACYHAYIGDGGFVEECSQAGDAEPAEDDYYCPECRRIIAKTPEEAEAFLRSRQ